MTSLTDKPGGAPGFPWRFYYDGYCGLCLWLVRRLARLDFSNAVAWVPFQSLDEPPQGLTWEALDRAVYLDTGAGPNHAGFFAIRKLTLKLPALWPLAPLFWFPGVHFPGTAVYRWVAAHRRRLSRCRPFPPKGDVLPPASSDRDPS